MRYLASGAGSGGVGASGVGAAGGVGCTCGFAVSILFMTACIASVIDLVCAGVSLPMHARDAGDDVAALRQSVVAADHLSSTQSLPIKSIVDFIMPFMAAGMVAISSSANFIETAMAPAQPFCKQPATKPPQLLPTTFSSS